jgi:hypothetical protein
MVNAPLVRSALHGYRDLGSSGIDPGGLDPSPIFALDLHHGRDEFVSSWESVTQGGIGVGNTSINHRASSRKSVKVGVGSLAIIGDGGGDCACDDPGALSKGDKCLMRLDR